MTELQKGAGQPPESKRASANRGESALDSRLDGAGADARLARQRIANLQAITAALGEALLPIDVARVVANEMAAMMGATQALVALPDEARTSLTLVSSSGFGADSLARFATFPIDADY